MSMLASDWGGEIQVWRKVGETHISFFFSLLNSLGRKGRRLLLAGKLYQHPGIGDSPLMMPQRP